MRWYEILICDTKRLKKDFSFLSEFGYKFDYALKHNISPSVVFCKNTNKIEIGYSYEENKFYANLFIDNCFRNESILSNYYEKRILVPDEYKKQLQSVIKCLKIFLN